MKAFSLLIVLLLGCSVHIFSQNVKIYGNIEDDNYGNVILTPGIFSYIIDSKTNLYPQNGYFEFNVSVSEPSLYYLYYKKKIVSLYVEPDKEIQMAIDNRKDVDFVIFLKDLAAENSFYNQDDRPYIGSISQRENFYKLAQKGTSSYFKYIELEIETNKMQYNIVDQKSKFSSAFKNLYIANEIDMAGMLYATLFPYYAGFEKDSFVVANPNFINIYNAINTKIDYSSVPKYYTVLMNFLKSNAYLEYSKQVKKEKLDPIKIYKYVYKNAEKYPYKVQRIIQDRAIGQWVMNYGNIAAMKDEISDFVASETSPERQELLKKRLVYLSQYETGNPAPIFTFYDEADNVRNLKEYVGKILYVLVWSSENKKSTDDIIASKSIYEDYSENNNIEFLYLSLDDIKENWKQSLIEYRMDEGIQGISFPDGINSDFAKKYNIQSIPSYILIDKSSNIISMHAPSPSQGGELKEMLNTILNE